MNTATVGHAGAANAPPHFSSRALNAAAKSWFVVAVSGQMIFLSYIIAYYLRSAVQGDFGAWNKLLVSGHIAGDAANNAAIISHIFIAAFVTLAGPLQLIPAIRARFPTFHRWTGRLYLVTAVVASIAGLFLVWARQPSGSFLQHVAISVNALLIIGAAWFVVRHAMARQLATHRRWALRLFLLVSGSWFFRVGLMFWIAINGGPVGFDPKTFLGPALEVISFLQFLLPLAVLELYFRAKASPSPAFRMSTAGTLFLMTAAMGLGILVASKGMWLPYIGR